MKELELVKQYQNTRDEQIENYFITMYLEKIQKNTFKIINKRFYSTPIEYGDIMSMVYYSIKQTLKIFNIDQNQYNVQQALYQNSIAYVHRQITKYLTNGHYILNNAYSIDDFFTSEQRTRMGHNPEDKWIRQIETDLIFEEQKETSKWFNDELTQRIIYLKSLGYKNREVSNILKIPVKKVSNVITYLKKKLLPFKDRMEL